MRAAKRVSPEGIRLVEEGNWTELIKRVVTTPSLAEQKDPYGMLPLHWACTDNEVPVEAIEALLKAYPEGGMIRNDSNLLPLHVAIRSNARVETLSMLCTMCPDCIWTKTDGRRPLSFATMSGLSDQCLRVLQKAEQKYRFSHPDADIDDDDDHDDPEYEEAKRDLYRQSLVMRESLFDSMRQSRPFPPSIDAAEQGTVGDDYSMIQETDDEVEPEHSPQYTIRSFGSPEEVRKLPLPPLRMASTVSTVDTSSERSERATEVPEGGDRVRLKLSPSLSERPTISSESSEFDMGAVHVIKALEERNAFLEQRLVDHEKLLMDQEQRIAMQERQHSEAMVMLAQTMARLAELEVAMSSMHGDFSRPHSFESTSSMEFPNPFTERFDALDD
ncbi:hypothetical protein LEN26_016306 [Aphanomyces euteiches]|nr:hypothetical protein LEN26_016306 [Aphanomyces euteiches]